MALVGDPGMPARGVLDAVMPTGWRLGPARLGRLQNGASTRAADLVKDGLQARVALAPVAELLAVMVSTLECAAADLEADMFGLEISPFLPPPLDGFLLP